MHKGVERGRDLARKQPVTVAPRAIERSARLRLQPSPHNYVDCDPGEAQRVDLRPRAAEVHACRFAAARRVTGSTSSPGLGEMGSIMFVELLKFG